MTDEPHQLHWQPMDKPGDLHAHHQDGGTYCIQHAYWSPLNTQWRLSYNIDAISEHPTIPEAQNAAEKHQTQTHRANLWTKYMNDNNPPTHNGANND